MTQRPIVSIVLGSYNRYEFLKLAIESIRREIEGMPAEIIVVDGGSDDGSAEWLIMQKDVITIMQHNRGVFRGKQIPRRSWGYFMNLGFKSAQGDYVLMMSDDTIFHPNAVKNGVEFVREQQAQGKKVGAVPFYFHDVIGEVEHQYKVSLLFGIPFLNHGIYVKSALEAVDYADETTYEFYAGDVDLCFKLIHAGYEIIPCKTALMLHYMQHPLRPLSSSSDRWMQDVTALVNKWKNKLIPADVTVIEGYTDLDIIRYVDPDNMGRLFEESISQEARDQAEGKASGGASGTAHTGLQLDQLDMHIQSLLKAVRYSIYINQKVEGNISAPSFYMRFRRWVLSTPLAKPLRNLKRGLVRKELDTLQTVDHPDLSSAPIETRLGQLEGDLSEVIGTLEKNMQTLVALSDKVKRRASLK